MSAMLLLGFFLGLRHALETDHVAAVATLVTRQRSFTRTLLLGAAWGVGHATTLFAACSVVLFLDTLVPARVAHVLEATVGVMLVLLGLDVLRRLRRDRVHFHAHRHHDGTVHVHFHSHRGEGVPHDSARHHHEHPRDLPLRALGVGMIHGLAGSAALMLLTVGSVGSPLAGLLYVALFGLGATSGMVLLSVVIAIPLRWSARHATRLHELLQGTVGAFTTAFGALLLYQNALLLAGGATS